MGERETFVLVCWGFLIILFIMVLLGLVVLKAHEQILHRLESIIYLITAAFIGYVMTRTVFIIGSGVMW